MRDETSPLGELAEQILRLSDEHGSTPVLVLPVHLTLRRPFYESLARELSRHTDRPIRFDWCHADAGWTAWITRRLAQWHATHLTQALRQAANAALVLTASIARPGGPRRDLVIGVCDERLPLPPWTTPIRIQ